MFALRIKNYGEILNRNLSHFTPWSVRAYILGHRIALKYARVSYELNQLINNAEYKSYNEDFTTLFAIQKQREKGTSTIKLKDLADRYQALALGMELSVSLLYRSLCCRPWGAYGDLRILLPERFGILGGILVNSLHDELNRVTVYTKRLYDPVPNISEPPVEAGGDGDLDDPRNSFNKQSCIEVMKDFIARHSHQV